MDNRNRKLSKDKEIVGRNKAVVEELYEVSTNFRTTMEKVDKMTEEEQDELLEKYQELKKRRC